MLSTSYNRNSSTWRIPGTVAKWSINATNTSCSKPRKARESSIRGFEGVQRHTHKPRAGILKTPEAVDEDAPGKLLSHAVTAVGITESFSPERREQEKYSETMGKREEMKVGGQRHEVERNLKAAR